MQYQRKAEGLKQGQIVNKDLVNLASEHLKAKADPL